MLRRTVIAALFLASLSACTQEPDSFTFAVVTDIQYATKETRGTRRYSEALDKLKEAVSAINAESPDFVLQLGDLIDENGERSEADFDAVIGALEGFACPIRHAVGNHCLDAGRAAYDERIGLPRYHYSFLHKGWRFVVLDGNDVSTRDIPEADPRQREAEGYMAADPVNKPWNGAIGKEQLRWLQRTLTEAERSGEPVIVVAHHPVAPDAAKREMVLWNYEAVLQVLDGAPHVVAYLAGHQHRGGYAVHASGIHHVVFPAICDAPEGGNAYALVDLRPGGMSIRGYGTVSSRELAFPKRRASVGAPAGLVPKGVGDFSFLGWSVFFGYFAAAALCYRAGIRCRKLRLRSRSSRRRRSSQRDEGRPSLADRIGSGELALVLPVPEERGATSRNRGRGRSRGGDRRLERVWFGLTCALVLLGINKQFDFQLWFNALGRWLAKSDGWYQYRFLAQVGVVLLVAVALIAAGLWFLREARPYFRELRPTLVGMLLVGGFVFLRALSFDVFDVRFRVAGIMFHELLEAAGVALVGWSAARFRWSADPDTEEVGRHGGSRFVRSARVGQQSRS